MENIKFAIVREDPIVEKTIIENFNLRNVLMVASGGCTALSLKSYFPKIDFSLFDFNPIQILHVKRKIAELQKEDRPDFKKTFNIGFKNKNGLNNSGEFESLFRNLKDFILEFITTEEEVQNILLGKSSAESIFSNKYWKVAFDLYFSDSILVTMFGPDAIQHAEPGSYPRYFQKVFEKGLSSSNISENYFMHHIFYGSYIDKKDALPYYLVKTPQNLEFDFIQNTLLNIQNISKFDLVSLSNIFDWMDEGGVIEHLNYLGSNLKKGSFVLFRQLNNSKSYPMKGFKYHKELAEELLSKDKSLFYNKINILEKI